MTYRSTARVVGFLFILATGSFSISVAVLEPILGDSNFLERIAAHGGRVAVGSLFELVNHIAVVCIAVVIYPVLRPFGERLALGYVVARSIEGVLFLVATMHLLALVQLSDAFVAAGSPSDSHFHTLSQLLFDGHDWNRVPFAFSAFALGSVVLNYSLFATRLVPRWISVFGLIAAASILTTRVLQLGGVDLPASTVSVMDGPIFVQEMVFAIWLIVRGFNQDGGATGKPSTYLERDSPPP